MFWFASFAKLIGSPGTTEAKLREGLSFNGDTLKRWDLRECNLTALPEEFGAVRTTGDLWLHNNKLTSLPESFGNLRVGGVLWLHDNQLTSLPESFANITVGGDLWLKAGGDIGPAMGEARALNYRNVKGKVHK